MAEQGIFWPGTGNFFDGTGNFSSKQGICISPTDFRETICYAGSSP
jgi:hypothetical protein